MFSLPCSSADRPKVATQAPSKDSRVLTTQWNWCGLGPLPLPVLARAPLKDGQYIHRKIVPICVVVGGQGPRSV
jgi:hypothetical protein